ASRLVLPPPLQGSLPAGWLAFTGRESNPQDRYKRFQIAVSSSFSGLSLAQGKLHLNPPSLARLCVRIPWQADREDRALARLARHGHVAAHHARELAGDGKAEPRAAEALSGRGIGLAELFEQLSLLLRSHANAGVSDRELDPLST